MKKQFKYLVLYFPLLITLSAFSGNSQNQFTHIASKENRSGNGDGTMLDIPQLNGNPKAIIFVTQKEQGLNPHPIGVYYFKGRWNIMNLDQAGIPVGSEFAVKYFIDPDKDHFQYLIKKENLQQKDGSAFIDHPALNNHPDAQFSVFHSWVPEAKEYGNRQEVQVHYDPGADKWVLSIVSNMVNKSLPVNSAYNINITSVGKPAKNPANIPVNTNPVNTNPVNTNPVSPSNVNSVSGPVLAPYMTIWANGIKLPGDNVRAAYLDKTEILGFEMGVESPRDQTTGLASVRRQHDPVTIKCAMGYPAAIPIFNAYVKNHTVVVTIEFYSQNAAATAGAGVEALNYTVRLSNAKIASFKQIYEEATLTGDAALKKSYYEIKLTYTKIEFIKDGVTVEDTF